MDSLIGQIAFDAFGRTFEVLAPGYFGLLLLIPLLAVIALFSLSDLPRFQRAINLGLRSLLVAVIAAALAQVVVTDFDSRVATVYLVDASASMPDDALDQAVDHINDAAGQLDDGDQLQVIAFSDRPYLVEPDADGFYDEIPRADNEDGFDTDIAAALRMAYGLYPDDHIRRAVLLSDGNETHGDLLAETNRAADFGIRLFTQPLDYERPPEVLIQSVHAPENVTAGEPFELTARIFSTHDDTVDIQLWRDEYRQDSTTVDVEPGVTEVDFDAEISRPGFSEFQFEMEVHREDTHEENNRWVHTVHAGDEPRVLYVEGEMRARHYIQRAVGDADFDLETRGATGLPRSAGELDEFDLVLISDVHADDMSRDQMELLDSYVRRGGGLILAGGENSFGPGGWQNTPLEELSPVTFEGYERREDPSVAILLVIDRSGSMGEHRRMDLAREAAREAVRELDDHAEIGVLTFDHEVTPVSPIQPVTNRSRIIDRIDGIRIRGGTDIALALEEAYDKMAFHPARMRHVLLLTDGIAPEDNIFTETMPAMRAEDITVSTVVVGRDGETSLMRRIADAGNGRFYFTDRAADIPRIFVDETTAVTESALIEEPVGAEVAVPAPVLEGIDWQRAPFLLGYVSTTARPDAEVLLTTDYGDPLLARSQVGLGRTVVFTSDVKNRWGAQWVRWNGFPQLWTQLIRDTMRTDDRHRLPMTAEIDGDHARVTVDALGDHDRFINDLDSELEVITPAGEQLTEPFAQTAPGRYEARFELHGLGAYELTAHHTLHGDDFATSESTLSYPYPRGLSFTDSNTELLAQSVEVTGGSTDADPTEVFDPDGEQIRYRRHLWPLLAAIAALLLLLDLGFRRVRLGGDTDVKWEELIGT